MIIKSELAMLQEERKVERASRIGPRLLCASRDARLRLVLSMAIVGVAVAVLADPLELPYLFSNGEVADANQINANFAALASGVGNNTDMVWSLEGNVDAGSLNGISGLGWQRRVSTSCPPGNAIRSIDANGNVTCEIDDQGAGDITSVLAGGGLSGGGVVGEVVLSIATGGILGGYLATDSVNSAKIVTDAVGSDEIAANAVGTDEIAIGAVGVSQLALGAVNSVKIQDNSILARHMTSNAVELVHMADDAVGSAEVVDGSLTAVDLANETGLDFVNETNGHALTSAEELISTVTISAPSNGNVLINVTGEWSAVGGSAIECSISETTAIASTRRTSSC